MLKTRLTVIALAVALSAGLALANETEPAPVSAPSVQSQAGGWWYALQDANLSALIEQGLRGNLDIEQARARIEQSRALLAGADAERMPGGGAHLAHTSTRVSESEMPGAAAGQRRQGSFGAGLDLSWEADLFGRLSSQSRAAAQRVVAGEAQADAVRLSVSAEIAHAYFAWLGASEQLSIARDILQGRESTAQVVASRVRLGSAGPIDDARAQADLESARADIHTHEAAQSVALHRIAVLTGQSPSGFSLPVIRLAAPAFVRIEVGDLADALARRPDLREAEALLKARSLDVASVRAELMPRLTFTGVLGYVAGSFANLGTGGSLSWLGSPSLLVPLLDRPRIEARIAAASAQERESLAAYRQRALLAAEEAESSMARYAAGGRRFDSLQRRALHAAEAERIARARYQAGTSDLLELLDAQRVASQARSQLAEAGTRQRQELAGLFKALGGSTGAPA